MTDEILLTKCEWAAKKHTDALNRIAIAFERMATTLEELERRVHGTKRRKKRSVKPK